MKWLALALLCIGCGNSDCVLADAPVVASGSATLSTDAGAFAMDMFAWTEASAPTVTKNVSFSISFGNAPSVECNRIAWASLARGAVVNVSQECVVIDGNNGAEAHITGATLSATSTLDAANEGTVTLRFGVPDQAVTGNMDIAVDVLVVSVSFAHVECSSGCSSSSFDLSGV